MPSSIASGPKFRSVKGGSKQRIAPDFTVSFGLAAADASGANTGKFVWIAPAKCVLLDVNEVHVTAAAAADSVRIKRVVASSTDAAGTAADADNVDLTDEILLDGANNTVQTVAALAAANIEEGDKIAVASAAGVATLAGGLITLRLAWR